MISVFKMPIETPISLAGAAKEFAESRSNLSRLEAEADRLREAVESATAKVAKAVADTERLTKDVKAEKVRFETQWNALNEATRKRESLMESWDNYQYNIAHKEQGFTWKGPIPTDPMSIRIPDKPEPMSEKLLAKFNESQSEIANLSLDLNSAIIALEDNERAIIEARKEASAARKRLVEWCNTYQQEVLRENETREAAAREAEQIRNDEIEKARVAKAEAEKVFAKYGIE